MKIYKSLLLAFTLALTGCASGSSILVGEAREPIAPEKVRPYIEPPESYDTIALLNASSDADLTMQGSIDYATEELKKTGYKTWSKWEGY